MSVFTVVKPDNFGVDEVMLSTSGLDGTVEVGVDDTTAIFAMP